MDAEREDAGGSVALLFVAVCLIAANMRATITGTGPLLDQIGADLGVTAAALGALASVPLLAWAALSPFAHGLTRRLGMNRTITWSLVALALGTIWRSLPGTTLNLWLGTALIGAGLAIANVLMPAVIKRDFGRRLPTVMAFYTALLGGVGALASGVVVPISHVPAGDGTLGWRVAFLCTGALLPVAIVAWLVTSRRRRDRDRAGGAASGSMTRIWFDGVAWLVAGYMGLQSAQFYMLVTWLAPISTSVGRSPVVAGVDVMVFQILGVVGSFLVPVLLRGRLRRWVPAILPVLGIVATAGLLLAPEAVLLWAFPAGLVSGASLNMALTLIAVRSRDHATAAALSGMAQSSGYVVGALGPIAFGWLHALTGDWTAPLLLLGATLVAQLVVGVVVGAERHVRTR